MDWIKRLAIDGEGDSVSRPLKWQEIDISATGEERGEISLWNVLNGVG